ncbi:elongation protein 1 [Dictyostelium discoideum AX4]|uniref:Elongator complex protein 1 n=1 Tax=Dictyostelium discoideum TaxID=44689 RepID=Q54Q66_DICDI|nr:elongation protein 1 [Dictyostelium discoideum AX4]EAL65378.1 elongation protein 1 [Dictyostelium discoideum AX4]|eukprot:XP_638731.1 elongation protein 1 [Dictyostelium discoideum AX4]
MKNITRLSEFNDLIVDGNGDFKLFSIDQQSNVVYFITENNQLIIYSPSTKKVSMRIELDEQDILSEGAKVISIQFIPDLDAVCMASNKGDILMYSTSNGELECVGIIGSGITCMSWSPDYELFILATESETLIQMTKDWEMINEVSINSYLPGKPKTATTTTNNNNSKNINKIPIITWRGDGQYFACSSYEEDIGKIQLRIWERSLQLHSMNESDVTGLENQISWRPNGSMIAVSQRLEQTRHDISFFERNGLKHGEFTLRSKGEIQSIQWSSDSEILGIQLYLEDEKRSVLQLWHRSNYYWFLKQEIQCGDSNNNNTNERIVNIQWDLSSPIVRVLTQIGRFSEYRLCWDYDVSQGSSENNPTTVVMVDGNQLKLTPFRRLVVPPPMSAYSIELPDRLNCLGFSFNQSTYQLSVMVDQSILIYTPATLPPTPKATLPKIKSANGLLAPLPSDFKANLPNYSIAPTLTSRVVIDRSKLQLHKIRHFLWLNASTFIGVESKTNQNSDSIVEIVFNVSSGELENIYRTSVSTKILRLTHHLQSLDQCLFESIDGYLHLYNCSTSASSGGNLEQPTSISPFIYQENIFKFPTPCPWFSSCTINQEDSVVGLNDRNKLYINQSLLCTDCNSFALHNKFLLFTTVSHVLRSVSLLAPPPTQPLTYVPVSNVIGNYVGHKSQALQQQSNYDDSIRDVERGSRIVAVVPHDTRLVLQMPRGNLEAISPRSLTLATIREMINNHQYLSAFLTMRRNRIDMNFIYDHNPTDFIRHIEEFVDQIQQIDYLNLFISSLRDEDTTKTLFIDLETKHLLPPTNVVKPSSIVVGKVNLVCDSLRKVFMEKDSIKFNLPILTTYVKKSPPELDQVLRLIQSLRGEEINEQGETIVNRLAEESLDYIVFLVDVNKLYDIALGTYDFELVIMVAQKSQKDPKEYIPFLQELQKMEKFYQRYSIDKYLSRWELALYNLSRAGKKYQQDCLDLIISNKIYKEALVNYGGSAADSDDNLIEEKDEMFKKVLNIYGDYLLESNQFEDAAYLFLQANQEKKSINAFRDAGLWENAISQANKLSYTKEQLNQLVIELSEILKRNSKFQQAAQCLEKFQLIDQAIHMYCEGYYFNEALLLSSSSSSSNQEEEQQIKIKKSLLDSLSNQINEINNNFEKYEKMSTRIVIVRTNKLNYVPLLLPRGQGDFETGSMMSGMSGMFSEGGMSVNSALSNVTTSSYVSTYSQQTGTFSTATKTRLKKKDKKQKPQKVRITGKEGSPYEEDYLVDQMKKLIPSSSQQESIGRIIKGLVLLGLFNDARQLSTLYQKYLNLIDSSLDDLSASATAILPENKKEKEREQRLQLEQLEEQQQQQQSQQQQQQQQTSTTSNNKIITLNIKQVVVSRDKPNWNLTIF